METGLRTMMLLALLSAFAMLTDDDDEKEEEKILREVMRRNKDLTRDEAMSMWKKKYTISDDKRKLIYGVIFFLVIP